MTFYGVLRICDHFYFILKERVLEQVPVMSCHVWKCLDATSVANLHIFLMKIILEVMKIYPFEG